MQVSFKVLQYKLRIFILWYSFLADVKPPAEKSEVQVDSKAGPSGSKSDKTDAKKKTESDVDMTEEVDEQAEKKS